MNLLVYLIPRIALIRVEPAATLVLDYLLNASKDVAQAFVDVVGRTGSGTFTPRRIVAEEQHRATVRAASARTGVRIPDGPEQARGCALCKISHRPERPLQILTYTTGRKNPALPAKIDDLPGIW